MDKKKSFKGKGYLISTSFITMLSLLILISCNPDIYSPLNQFVYFSVVSSPKNLKASVFDSKDTITLTWDKVEGAGSYLIERKAGDGAFEELSNSTSTTYSDTITEDVISRNGYEYSYRVSAVSSTGLKGQFSKEVKGRLLYAPSNVSATKGKSDIKGKIAITWDKIEGINEYDVYAVPQTNDLTTLDAIKSALQGATPIKVSSNSYTYTLGEADKTKNIFFAVSSVSPSSQGNESDFSSIVIGYALSENAPPKVDELKVSGEVSPDTSKGLTISWKKPTGTDNPTYSIFRSSQSSLEEELKNISVQTIGDSVTFTDNSQGLKTGTLYTYTVAPIKDGIRGEAVSINASFLSSPDSVSVTGITKSGSTYGYELTFSAPVGLGHNDEGYPERSNWQFVIYGINNKTTPKPSEDILKDTRHDLISDDGLKVLDSSYKASASEISSPTVSSAKYNSSDNTYTVKINSDNNNNFRVTVKNSNGDESYVSPGIGIFKGLNIRNFEATDNYYDSSLSHNSNNVYPVILSFLYDPIKVNGEVKDDWYTIKVTKNIEELKVPTLDLSDYDGFLSFRDSSPTNDQVGIKNKYTLIYSDIFGNTSTLKDEGYGSITTEELIGQMEYFALKPWEHMDMEINSSWKDSSVYNKIAAAGLGSLGSAEDQALAFSPKGQGRVMYHATVGTPPGGGIGGKITITYEGFGVVDYINATGGFEMVVSMRPQDGSCIGVPNIAVQGLYPADVSLDKISIRDGRFTGPYIVTQSSRGVIEEIPPYQGVSNDPSYPVT